MIGRDDPRARPRPRARRPGLALAALYTVAAVVATLPASLHLGSEFIAEGRDGHGEAAYGDHLQSVYRFWLVGHQLGRGDAPWRDPYSFQPLVDPQPNLGGWPWGLVYWPLHAVAGAVVAWNVLLLATVVAAGLLTAAWLRALGLGRVPAALGGLAFALAPYRLLQSGGHLVGWAAVLLPLVLLAIERSRAARGARAHAWGALAAAALVSLPLSGQLHLALGALPFALAYAAVRFGAVPAAWTLTGAAGAAAVGLAVRATVISESAAGEGRSLAEVTYYSASLVDLVSRVRLHGLERYVFVGWLTPALALAGLVVLWRRQRALAAVLGAAAVVPLVLALGTHTPVYEPLRDLLPPLRFPRVPGRMTPLANLALAALAAWGTAAVLARVRPGRVALAGAALVGLVALDLLVFPLRPSDADAGNGAYAALARVQPGRLLPLPVLPVGEGHFGSVYDYYATEAPRERPTGYSTVAPRATRAFAARFDRLSCGVWRADDAGELDRLGIRYVVFHRGVYDQARQRGAWFAWRALARQGYRAVARDGAVTLLARERGATLPPPVAEPPHGSPVLCQGWLGRSMRQVEAPLWVWGATAVELELSARARIAGRVSAAGGDVRFAVVPRRPTRVRLPVGAAGWQLVTVRVARLLGTRPREGVRLVSVRPVRARRTDSPARARTRPSSTPARRTS